MKTDNEYRLHIILQHIKNRLRTPVTYYTVIDNILAILHNKHLCYSYDLHP